MTDGSRYSCGGSFNILSPGSSSTRLNWLLFWKFDELPKGGLKPPKISTGRQCSMTASLQVLLPTYISLGYPFLREQTQKIQKLLMYVGSSHIPGFLNRISLPLPVSQPVNDCCTQRGDLLLLFPLLSTM